MANPEDILHLAVVDFLDLALRPAECVWMHYPSGGLRTKRQGAKLKALGARAGVPDLMFIRPGWLGFIELKAADGATSRTQKAFIRQMEAMGHPCAVCRSVEEVEAALRSWSVILNASVLGAGILRGAA